MGNNSKIKIMSNVPDSQVLRCRRCGEDDNDEEDFMGMPAKRNIRRDGPHIYFYDGIDEETHLIFIKMFNKATDYLMSKYRDIIPLTGGMIPEGISIHINSPGGDAVSSLAIYDTIKESDVPVFGIVEGMAASGASIMLCACERRLMTKNSMVLCHELRSISGGKWSELIDDHENNELLMKKIKDIYTEETKIPAKELTNLLTHDLYWDAEKCKKYGIVDSVIGASDKKEQNQKAGKKKAAAPKSVKKEKNSTAKADENIEKKEGDN